MKYILLLPLLISITLSKAQAPVKEYGIGLANFDQFSLQYRWGDGTKFYRITGNAGAAFALDDKITITGSGNSGISTSRQTTPYDISVGAGFSVLKLKPLNEKIGWMYGINYSISFSAYEYKISLDAPSSGQTYTNSSSAIRPSIGPVLGGYFKFNDSFFLYAEIIPNVYYQHWVITSHNTDPGVSDIRQETSSDSFGISSLSNSSASLTFAYRIATIAK